MFHDELELEATWLTNLLNSLRSFISSPNAEKRCSIWFDWFRTFWFEKQRKLAKVASG
jgi:hypothetical protein